MQVSVRSYLAAGVALVGASAVALSPVTSPPDVHVPATSSAEVQLSASWTEAFTTASENATTLAEFYTQAPAAALQQSIVNHVGYLRDVLNDPASIGAGLEAIRADVQTAWETATLIGDAESIEDLPDKLQQSNELFHYLIAGFLPQFLPEDMTEEDKALVTQIVNVLASPLSGVLIAAVGPAIAPAVAALNTLQTAAQSGELSDLADLPSNVVDGFLNGATLNLDGLLPAINGAGLLPEGTTVDRLGIAFGGLLSPGSTVQTPGEGPNVGGSILSSVDLVIKSNALGPEITLPATGVPLGPIAALANLSQMVAASLGWDGEGNPLEDLTSPDVEPESGDATTRVLAANEIQSAPVAQRLKLDNVSSLQGAEAQNELEAATTDPSASEQAPETSPTAGDDAGDAPRKVVRQSPKAVPGETGGELNGAADSIGKQLNSTATKISDGLKNRLSKSTKKGAEGDGNGAAAKGASSDAGSDE